VEWDEIDVDECAAGYRETNRGDPEPGENHTRSYHHGWRMRMHDLGEIKAPAEHMRLVREIMDRDRVARGDYTVGEGKHASRPRSVEQALAHAQAIARRQGCTARVFRASDGAHIASVQPDGKIDLTWEGSIVA